MAFSLLVNAWIHLPFSMPLAAASLAEPERAAIGARLKAAYPDAVKSVEDNDVVLKDGSRLPLADERTKTFDAWLDTPDIADMFRQPYPAGAIIAPPAENFDPGRARNADFFRHVYGDCRTAGFAKSLTAISWLPRKFNQKVEVTTIGGVADKFKAVSDELDQLPARFDPYLRASGAFNCRSIAGTKRASAHGYGVAIDIGVRLSNYWRSAAGGRDGALSFKNAMPAEVVSIFEKHGFIWGGRWYHYDTMHFEYRPELFTEPDRPAP